jgi:hypothetical protein
MYTYDYITTYLVNAEHCVSLVDLVSIMVVDALTGDLFYV